MLSSPSLSRSFVRTSSRWQTRSCRRAVRDSSCIRALEAFSPYKGRLAGPGTMITGAAAISSGSFRNSPATGRQIRRERPMLLNAVQRQESARACWKSHVQPQKGKHSANGRGRGLSSNQEDGQHLSPVAMRAGSWNGPGSTASPLFFPLLRPALSASIELRLWASLRRCSCSSLASRLLPLQYKRLRHNSL